MLASCVAWATYIPEEWLLCFALLHSKSNAHHSICFNHVEGYSLVFCFVWVGPLVYICSIAPYAICLLLLCKNKWLKELIILAIDLMLYFLSLLYARMGVQVVSLIFLWHCLLYFIIIDFSSFHVLLCQCDSFSVIDISILCMQWESILGAIVEKCTTSEGICIFICIPLEIWHEPTGCWWPWGD